MAGELNHIIPTHPSDPAHRASQTRQIVYVDPNGTQHDIIAVYWSDSNAQSHLIWKKQKEYRFVDCTGYNNEQPSFILRINKSCELNSITVYMSLNNTKFSNVILAKCIDLNDENIDITEETTFFRNTKVIANNSNFTISSELCDFKTVNNEDVYKITFTLNNLIISTGLYYFTFFVSTDNNMPDRKLCYSNSTTVARNFIYNSISDTVDYPMWTQSWDMSPNSDNIQNGYVDYSISSTNLNWGDNQPFASCFAEFELYDDIDKKLMWNMYAYYPVSQGTAGTKLNVNDCVKSYDVWPDRITTNYLYLSAHSVYSANGESMFSTQVLANNNEMTPSSVGSFPYSYNEPDDQAFLHCIDTYNYTRNYVNDSNVVPFILYTPTANCKLSSVSYLNGNSNAETPIVNVGVVELDSSMRGVSNLGSFTDDHIIKYKSTSVTTGNNSTVDMMLYKHYRKPVNDISLEANKTYAISICNDTQNRQYQFYRTNVANGTLANDNRHYPVVALNPWSYGNTSVTSLNISAYAIITTANN